MADAPKLLELGPQFEAAHLGTRRIAEYLDRNRLTRDWEWKHLEALASYLEGFEVKGGRQLFAEGDRDRMAMFIADGRVRIEKRSGNKSTRITTIGADQTLGEMSLIDGQPRSASAIAETDVLVFVLSESAFERLEQTRPELTIALLKKICWLMSQRLRSTSGALVDSLNQ